MPESFFDNREIGTTGEKPRRMRVTQPMHLHMDSQICGFECWHPDVLAEPPAGNVPIGVGDPGPPRLIFARNFHINKADFVIVGIFILTWIIALSIWRLGKIEQRCDLAAAKANALD